MKKIGKFEHQFPETKEECEEWKPYIGRHALSCRVLAVATTRIEGMWAAYCCDVPGINHDNEEDKVLQHGDKLQERVARALFAEFEGVPYAK